MSLKNVVAVGIYGTAAVALAKRSWDYIQLVRKQNKLSDGAIALLNDPELVEARQQADESLARIRRNHPSNQL